ncbi:MAG: RES domain-containing protein [Gammaproteobacteria bacterium]|nr:RES domain-containing protein [Gammaproteobacteria bacterium]
MQFFRIAPEQYLENYQGLGASYRDGGRWNKPGQPVLYYAKSPATALLEMANYIPSPRLLPANFQLGIYEIPDSVQYYELPEKLLPANWADFPYPLATQTIGGKWLEQCQTLFMLVPSAAVPKGLEKIIIVNPRHEECSKIKLIDSTHDLYNNRIFSGI